MVAINQNVGQAPQLRLGGQLASIAGPEPDIRFDTIRQAAGLLWVNHPEIIQLKDVEVVIRLNGEEVGASFCDMVLGPGAVVEIMPAIAGGSDGAGKLLVGALLIAATVATGGGFAAVAGSTGWSGFLFSQGVSLVVKGVEKMMETPEEPEKRSGGPYNGPRQTTGEGHPVPLLYGYARVSGALIHRTIDTEDK